MRASGASAVRAGSSAKHGAYSAAQREQVGRRRRADEEGESESQHLRDSRTAGTLPPLRNLAELSSGV